MPLVVYGHRFSSYTQKVLLALYENDTSFEFRGVGPDQPENTTDWLGLWPIRKFPVLVDGDRTVAETSIIIEYLDRHHPGPVRFLPDDPTSALEVRFLDRFFDLHVMDAAQHAVNGALTGMEDRARDGQALAEEKLERSYAWLEAELAGRDWAAGDAFTLADCAASPSLFYADWVHRISDSYPVLRAYRTKLLARPAYARAVEDERPYRNLFPLGAPDRD